MPAVPTMSTPIWLRRCFGALLSPPASCLAAPSPPPRRPPAPTAIPPRVQRRDQGQDPRPALGAASWHAAVRRGRLRPLPGAEGAGPDRPQLAPHTPYRLFLTGKDQSIRNTPDGSGVIHGVTDAQGRTAWIWTETDHLARDFTLVRLAGDYSWGQVFQLSSSGEHAPVAGYPTASRCISAGASCRPTWAIPPRRATRPMSAMPCLRPRSICTPATTSISTLPASLN